VDEFKTLSPYPVSQYDDLSTGDFLTDHIVIMSLMTAYCFHTLTVKIFEVLIDTRDRYTGTVQSYNTG